MLIQPVSFCGMAEEWYDRAKRRMRELGLTQEGLKKPLRVKTRGAVGHYLTGRRDPTPFQFAALATVLKTTTDWLLTGTSAMADESGQYQSHGVGTLSRDEHALVRKYRQLSPKERTQLQAIGDALASANAEVKKKTG